MAKKKRPNIEFHSLLDGITNIEERNKAFKRLSKEGQRLEIAWDCLKLIEAESICSIGTGVGYWGNKLISMKSRIGLHTKTTPETKPFVDCLNALKPKENCNVCARGGLMVSTIRLNNGLRNFNYMHMQMGSSENIEGFSLQDFYLIESEYESSEFAHPYERGTNEKLMNIMCNILVNGNFNPKDKKDYLI